MTLQSLRVNDPVLLLDFKEMVTFSESKTVTPPKWMQENAKRGLRIREEQPASNRCCTRVGLARANTLAKGGKLSLSTVNRMKSFAARHGANLKTNTEPNSKLAQGLLLWGISPTKSGVKRVIDWCDRQINKMESS